VSDDARVLDGVALAGASAPEIGGAFERAGPREQIYFDPSRTTAGIVTAGGVSPGINDVVRGLVVELQHRYGVRCILGFRFGFSGLEPDAPNPPIELTTEVVRDLHTRGGTFLGTARGLRDIERLADGLVRWGVDVLFTIGGDGTMRATHALAGAAEARKLAVSLVTVPKTVDNDIPFVDKTFGFDSAVTEARRAIDAAHAEARSVDRGWGWFASWDGTRGSSRLTRRSRATTSTRAWCPRSRFGWPGRGGSSPGSRTASSTGATP
jgi:6-phosphofructokinase 1